MALTEATMCPKSSRRLAFAFRMEAKSARRNLKSDELHTALAGLGLTCLPSSLSCFRIQRVSSKLDLG